MSLNGGAHGQNVSTLPVVQREYRAVWIATVSNIDWPSTNRISVSRQKAELIALLDKAAALNLNTVIFQVRPSCDALYPSRLEPWSEYLTGTMGTPPKPFYDPLALAIEEAHKRGLELHAWFNPYRARHPSAKSAISANHISRTNPRLVKQYGNFLWLDPGEKEVQDHSCRVVMDVVGRYDVDGIHFDDYFYPYKVKGANGRDLDFPDDASWERVGRRSNLSRDDWRRENVNQFIDRVNREIKRAKPWVKFGISPFGIWRPGFPAEIQGLDAYEQLYADSRKWLRDGSMDYFAPQLYWSIEARQQSFPALLKWWSEQNVRDRHLIPGLDSTRWGAAEIARQVSIARKQSKTSGQAFWNMKSLMRKTEVAGVLSETLYRQPALPPALAWLDRTVPAAPRLSATGSKRRTVLTWSPGDQQPIGRWILHTRSGEKWTTRILGANTTRATLDSSQGAAGLIAVDRFGNTSRATVVDLPRQ